MNNLWDHRDELEIVLDAFNQAAQRLPRADVLLGVPTGGQRLGIVLSEKSWIDLPVARLERIPGGAKQDFRFVSKNDRELALDSNHVLIVEDVVSTLSSVAGVIRHLDPGRQEIHAISVWRRGYTKEKYARGLTPHYLVEELINSYLPDECPICNGRN